MRQIDGIELSRIKEIDRFYNAIENRWISFVVTTDGSKYTVRLSDNQIDYIKNTCPNIIFSDSLEKHKLREREEITMNKPVITLHKRLGDDSLYIRVDGKIRSIEITKDPKATCINLLKQFIQINPNAKGYEIYDHLLKIETLMEGK